AIPVPPGFAFDPSNRTWKLRIHNLDARNTWFVRSSAKATVPGSLPCTLGDRVWDDGFDCNGVQDANELGLDGVRINLFTASTGARDANGLGLDGVGITPFTAVGGVRTPATPVATQLTHTVASGVPFPGPGNYLFVDLPPADYEIELDPSTVPAGYATHPGSQ